MRTIINKLDNDWKNAKNKCRVTVGKEHTDNEASRDFIRKLLISEHSPIRVIKIDWSWKGIKSWVATQWSRHVWTPWISTRRSDRTGIDRGTLSQDETVDFDGEMNAQNGIDTMRKRLCKGCVSPETYELAVDLKLSVMEQDYNLGYVFVPNCIYRCGCPEFEPCNFFNQFLTNHQGKNLSDIDLRYYLYNKDFRITG